MSKIWSRLRIGVLATALAITTLAAVAVIGTVVPQSETRDAITDAMSLPGGVLAALAYPEGLHTGQGTGAWAPLAFFGNVFFYTVLWCFALAVWNARSRAKRERHHAAGK